MNMKKAVEILSESALFRGLNNEELEELLGADCSRIREFSADQRVFDEGDRPEHIMVLMSGSVLIARDTITGKRILLTRVGKPGGIFGEIYVFSNLEAYDMFGEAQADSTVLFLSVRAFEPGQVPGLGRRISEIISRNLTGIFAQKAYGMNRRLRILASSSIREKIARFLLEQGSAEKTGTDPAEALSCGDSIRVMAREEMADYLNVTRPSLSRELSSMAKEGILEVDGREIRILDEEKLEDYL